MPVTVNCPCGRTLRARDEQAGRRCKCPGCGNTIEVPFPAPAELPKAAAGSAGVRDALHEIAAAAAEARASATPGWTAPPAPAAAPVPVAAIPVYPAQQLSTGDPPWRAKLYWLLLLLILPLAWSTLAGPTDPAELLDRTIEAHPELEEQIVAAEEGEADIEDVLDALPGNKLVGALHARGSWFHWVYALISGLMFFGVILLASPGKSRESIELGAEPDVKRLHLLWAGLFTGTLGVVLLVALQVAGLFCCLGALYLAALHPDAPFGASLLGFVLGVGFCEEGIKAMPVIWRMYRPTYLSWQGACLLGMASGAGFGVSEGIHYSTNYYNGLSGAEDYVLRFTSVAGLHVLLSGACGILLHRHQRHLDEGSDWADWLLTMAAIITVPMVLHGLYNTLLKKDFTVIALFIWGACFAWLAYLIESSRKREARAVSQIAKAPRLVRTARGMRWVQE